MRAPIEGQYAKDAMAAANKVIDELERARQMASDGKVTFRELEESMKVNDSTAHRMFTGDVSITLERFFQLCMIFKIDPATVIGKAKAPK